MRLVYIGTPQFAVPPLRALAAAGHTIVGVVTRIDKPAGRGKSLAAPAVKLAAQDMGLTVFQPRRVRDQEFIETLRKLEPEGIIVAAYGQILPREILDLPLLLPGCINIHASLLPRYRGAAPVHWAIIRGEQDTGITIMQMDEGMDTGAILMQERIPIEPTDTAGSLTQKLSELGARLITTALPLIASGRVIPQPQDHAQATLAPLLKKEEGIIDWTLSAAEIRNRVRGLSPWPGAFSFLSGVRVKIIDAKAQPGTGEPGILYAKENNILHAGTGNGILQILVLQPEGKKSMTAAEFLRGYKIEGKKFETTGKITSIK
ncbi:MAG: methionyl-tRNA formyltransferase [Nitrospirota bacterium]